MSYLYHYYTHNHLGSQVVADVMQYVSANNGPNEVYMLCPVWQWVFTAAVISKPVFIFEFEICVDRVSNLNQCPRNTLVILPY